MKSQHFLFGNSIIFIWEDLAGLINGTNQRDAKWTQSIAACPVKPGFSFNWGGEKNLCWKQKLNWVQRQSAAMG
jgi:hypothetical protein